MDKEYFRINSFYTSAFLYTKGLELVGIDKSDNRRACFLFIDSPKRALLMESFNFGKEDSREVLVDARKFVTAIKALKDKLYQNQS